MLFTLSMDESSEGEGQGMSSPYFIYYSFIINIMIKMKYGFNLSIEEPPDRESQGLSSHYFFFFKPSCLKASS